MSTLNRRFTVVVLLPEHVAADYGQDHYTAHVWARDPESAMADAQSKASVACASDDTKPHDPVSLDIGPVFLGHHEDISQD